MGELGGGGNGTCVGMMLCTFQQVAVVACVVTFHYSGFGLCEKNIIVKGNARMSNVICLLFILATTTFLLILLTG